MADHVTLLAKSGKFSWKNVVKYVRIVQNGPARLPRKKLWKYYRAKNKNHGQIENQHFTHIFI